MNSGVIFSALKAAIFFSTLLNKMADKLLEFQTCGNSLLFFHYYMAEHDLLIYILQDISPSSLSYVYRAANIALL